MWKYIWLYVNGISDVIRKDCSEFEKKNNLYKIKKIIKAYYEFWVLYVFPFPSAMSRMRGDVQSSDTNIIRGTVRPHWVN